MAYVPALSSHGYQPMALGLDLKAEAVKACKDHAGDNKIAAAICDCMKDLKADREHFKMCAAAAARVAATGYCYGVSLCGDVAAFIAGPLAGAVYDVGDALARGVSDLFGGGETECGCPSCFWGKCWSALSEPQKLTVCEGYEASGKLKIGPTECPDVIARRGAARLDAVTRVNAAYTLWIRGMVKALNDKALPELAKLGKPVAPFTPAYIEALLARHLVSAQDAGYVVSGTPPAWWSQKSAATKPTSYGWFQRTGWDAPIRVGGVIADPYAVARAEIWARMLMVAEPLVFADVLKQIAESVRLVDKKKLQDFSLLTLARQQSQKNAAMTGALVLLTGAALAGIVIYRKRRK